MRLADENRGCGEWGRGEGRTAYRFSFCWLRSVVLSCLFGMLDHTPPFSATGEDETMRCPFYGAIGWVRSFVHSIFLSIGEEAVDDDKSIPCVHSVVLGSTRFVVDVGEVRGRLPDTLGSWNSQKATQASSHQ